MKGQPPERYRAAIQSSGLSIYDLLPKDSPLFVPTRTLEAMLNGALRGFSTAGMPLRTRSKMVKIEICKALGYPVPQSFRKCRPLARFPSQNFDTYVQASNNLQVWNEELMARRRYVLVSVDNAGLIVKVRVINGSALAKLDRTGTLTQKYQARFTPTLQRTELITLSDTANLLPMLNAAAQLSTARPTDDPQVGQVIPIQQIYGYLTTLVGRRFTDAGHDQERNRGAGLHRLVCAALGYTSYADDGQFPDVRHQLLEVKLQTAQTIDLGLVEPTSTEEIDLDLRGGDYLRHCDVRYAIFGAKTDQVTVQITSLVLTTEEAFFTRFPRFEGRVLNKKLQIPLPRDFFTESKR